MNIYCISSPFQLVSALEARHHFPADRNILIIRDVSDKRKEHRDQVENLSSQSRWDEIIHWPMFRGGRIQQRWRRASFIRRFAGRIGSEVDCFLMAGFSQEINHMLRGALNPSRTILLDDGVSTLKHVRNHLLNGHFLPGWLAATSVPARILGIGENILAGVRTEPMKQPMEVFTCFCINPPSESLRIHQHTFEHLKNLRADRKIDQSRVEYFGSPLSERGIITLNDEMAILERVQNHYGEHSRQVTYIAHRDDAESKLQRLRDMGMETTRLPTTVEFHFVSSEQLPGTVASSISTALHNIFLMFPEITAELFPLPFDRLLDRKGQAEDVTQHYRDMGIQTIELN